MVSEVNSESEQAGGKTLLLPFVFVVSCYFLYILTIVVLSMTILITSRSIR
jgi:hypothetical protein